MTTPALTPAAVMLLGIDAFEAESGVGIGRAKWAARALVEALWAAMPSSGAVSACLLRFWDPQRGISDRVVARATNELLDSGFLEPAGVGDEAVWLVSPDRAAQVQSIWGALRVDERAAIRTAAQRALAMSVAWSNTRLVAAESRRDTATSGATRRHP